VPALCRSIPLTYVVPAKKEEHDKEGKEGEEDANDEGKPDVKTRVDEAVRDAKVALLKVRSSFVLTRVRGSVCKPASVHLCLYASDGLPELFSSSVMQSHICLLVGRTAHILT
jgi:hypothetical protein